MEDENDSQLLPSAASAKSVTKRCEFNSSSSKERKGYASN